jgi:hypothetical protein
MKICNNIVSQNGKSIKATLEKLELEIFAWNRLYVYNQILKDIEKKKEISFKSRTRLLAVVHCYGRPIPRDQLQMLEYFILNLSTFTDEKDDFHLNCMIVS